MKPDYSARKRGEPTLPLANRLYSHIQKNERSGCWEWQGSKRNGYGRMIIGSRTDGTRKSESAHRIMLAEQRNMLAIALQFARLLDSPTATTPQQSKSLKQKMQSHQAQMKLIWSSTLAN
jgi:hypothetical protein